MPTITRGLDAPVVLQGIPYATYLRLRRTNPRYRMTYYDGALEIMSPAIRHERPTWRLGAVVRAMARAARLDCSGAGHTTFHRGGAGRERGVGKEPDASFYFGANEQRVRDRETIDLTVDPPPDLWIEVDHRGSSKGRLPLYARLEVPEVWRYRVKAETLWFGRRQGDQDVAIDRSLALPMLTPELVLFALGQARGVSETTWSGWLDNWAATLVPPQP